jgi:predicted RNase H-like nuclease (RuvC/YqgF family)
VIRENRGLLQTLDGRIAQYAQQEQEATRTMKELNRLLTELSADRSGNEIHMTNSARSGREIERLQKTIEEQGERQEELLGELITSVKELTKASKKGSKLPLFK